MKNIIKLANILDNLGSYVLSDKLYKIAETYVPPIDGGFGSSAQDPIFWSDPYKPEDEKD